jgi:hypothetical protein
MINRSFFFSLTICFLGFTVNAQVNVPRSIDMSGTDPAISSFESARHHLKLRVIAEDVFDDSTKMSLLFRQDFSGLISVVVLDHENAIRFLKKTDVSSWNVPVDSVFEIAIKNTKKQLENLDYTLLKTSTSRNYEIVYDEENYFTNTILYFPELLDQFDSDRKGIVVGMPARHLIAILELESPKSNLEAIKEFQYFLAQAYSNEDNPTSLNIFVFIDHTCQVIMPLYDDSGNFMNFLVPLEIQYLFQHL